MNTLVESIVSQLDPALKELFDERAAIMEFEGNLDRNYAEALALLDVLHRHPEALIGTAKK
jgi:hypothetical protein